MFYTFVDSKQLRDLLDVFTDVVIKSTGSTKFACSSAPDRPFHVVATSITSLLRALETGQFLQDVVLMIIDLSDFILLDDRVLHQVKRLCDACALQSMRIVIIMSIENLLRNDLANFEKLFVHSISLLELPVCLAGDSVLFNSDGNLTETCSELFEDVNQLNSVNAVALKHLAACRKFLSLAQFKNPVASCKGKSILNLMEDLSVLLHKYGLLALRYGIEIAHQWIVEKSCSNDLYSSLLYQYTRTQLQFLISLTERSICCDNVAENISQLMTSPLKKLLDIVNRQIMETELSRSKCSDDPDQVPSTMQGHICIITESNLTAKALHMLLQHLPLSGEFNNLRQRSFFLLEEVPFQRLSDSIFITSSDFEHKFQNMNLDLLISFNVPTDYIRFLEMKGSFGNSTKKVLYVLSVKDFESINRLEVKDLIYVLHEVLLGRHTLKQMNLI